MYKLYKYDNKEVVRTAEFTPTEDYTFIKDIERIKPQTFKQGDCIKLSPEALINWFDKFGYMEMDNFINQYLIVENVISPKTIVIQGNNFSSMMFEKVEYDHIEEFKPYFQITSSIVSFPHSMYSVLARVSEGMIKWEENGKKKKIKPGRWAKKYLDCNDDIQCFSNMVNSYNLPVTLEIVKGKDILTAYHEDNYLNSYGDLGSSCMRYESTQNNIRFYTKQPDIALLVAKIDGKVVGRAILWEEFKFMDRIYTCYDYLVYKFKYWATSNNWTCKKYQNNDSDIAPDMRYKIKYTGQLLDKTHHNDYDVYEFMPYMDTFKYLKIEDDEYYLSTRTGDYTLENTDEQEENIWDTE